MKLFKRLSILSKNQMHMTEFWPSKSKCQSLHTSRCSTKLGLLGRMQLYEGEGGIWDHLTNSQKSLEESIEHPLLSWIKPLNWKWAWEEESLTKDYSPAPERKTQRLIPSPRVRNSPENSSATTQSTSKSQSTICSMHKHYPSSLTPSRSKYYKGKQLTSISSSLWSTPPSQITEPLNHSETLNCNLGTWSRQKRSKLMETGLSCMAHSNMWCSLSTCTGKVSSSATGNTSQHILPL